MHNLSHSRVSPSIQVMAKGIIQQTGTHILDLNQENGEFLSPAKLSVSWKDNCGKHSGCFYINAGIHISMSPKIWEEFELSFICLYLGFAQIFSNSLCQLSFF